MTDSMNMEDTTSSSKSCVLSCGGNRITEFAQFWNSNNNTYI